MHACIVPTRACGACVAHVCRKITVLNDRYLRVCDRCPLSHPDLRKCMYKNAHIVVSVAYNNLLVQNGYFSTLRPAYDAPVLLSILLCTSMRVLLFVCWCGQHAVWPSALQKARPKHESFALKLCRLRSRVGVMGEAGYLRPGSAPQDFSCLVSQRDHIGIVLRVFEPDGVMDKIFDGGDGVSAP